MKEDKKEDPRMGMIREAFLRTHFRYENTVLFCCGIAIAISMFTGAAPKFSLIMWALGLSVAIMGFHFSFASYHETKKNIDAKSCIYDKIITYILNPLQGLLFVVGLLVCVFSKGA